MQNAINLCYTQDYCVSLFCFPEKLYISTFTMYFYDGEKSLMLNKCFLNLWPLLKASQPAFCLWVLLRVQGQYFTLESGTYFIIEAFNLATWHGNLDIIKQLNFITRTRHFFKEPDQILLSISVWHCTC